MYVPSYCGYIYFVTFITDASRWTKYIFLKFKNETFIIFKYLKFLLKFLHLRNSRLWMAVKITNQMHSKLVVTTMA
jgi:hypothetical protein